MIQIIMPVENVNVKKKHSPSLFPYIKGSKGSETAHNGLIEG